MNKELLQNVLLGVFAVIIILLWWMVYSQNRTMVEFNSRLNGLSQSIMEASTQANSAATKVDELGQQQAGTQVTTSGTSMNTYSSPSHGYTVTYPTTAGIRNIALTDSPDALLNQVEIYDPMLVDNATPNVIVHISVWSDASWIPTQGVVQQVQRSVNGNAFTLYSVNQASDVGAGTNASVQAWMLANGRYYELDFPGVSDLNSTVVTNYLGAFSLK